MKTIFSIFIKTLVFSCLVLSMSCPASKTVSEMVLVGSTPCDSTIKLLLSIPANEKTDFIKWNLKLTGTSNDQNTFSLSVNYGESQPNTLGFKNGGIERSFEGTCSIIDNRSTNGSEIYQLNSKKFSGTISLLKISENLFHVLTPQNRLMTGNGGWSYTLNREVPVFRDKILIVSSVSDTNWLQLVYDGRTPCREISNQHPEMNTSPSCFKLKWKLILNKDSLTHHPATCVIRKVVDNQPRDISGKWTLTRGLPEKPDAIIYTIAPDKPGESISLLVADDNVLFFLDKNNLPYIGNKDFSYTLNNKKEATVGK
ncbi:MAG: hypothetical protein U0W24_14020 [Bacteroidales bacterium]